MSSPRRRRLRRLRPPRRRKRLPPPLYPGSDTLGTLDYLRRTGYDHSWFILSKKIIAREFALSGSEQNPDLTGRDRKAMVASRFGGGEAIARLMVALLLTLKGTTLLYQGEELGLPEAQSLTREEIRDPVGDLYWPISKGRDGSRTPMPWSEGKNLGFSSAKPWLPSAVEHEGMSAATQEADPGSTLALSRALIAQRKASAALTRGELELIDAPEPLLAFFREEGAERIACVFNMSGERHVFGDARLDGGQMLPAGPGEARLDGGALHLGPYAARFVKVG